MKKEDDLGIKDLKEVIKKNEEKRKKNPKSLAIAIIDWALIITFICVIIYAVIQGHYTDVKIVEVCNGMPILP